MTQESIQWRENQLAEALVQEVERFLASGAIAELDENSRRAFIKKAAARVAVWANIATAISNSK